MLTRSPSSPPLPRIVVALAATSALVLAAYPFDGRPGTGLALGIVVLSISLWATAVVAEHITSLVFFTLCTVTAVAPPEVVFSGFAAQAVWLIFGGMVLGFAIGETGLGTRIAARLGQAFGSGYAGVIAGLIVVGMVLGFLMPSSMGRVVLLMPVALALASRHGFTPGTRGHTGIVMATAMACFMPTTPVLPANVPTVVLMGAAETLYDAAPTYGAFLLLHFPTLGALKAILIWAVVLWMYPDTPRPSATAAGEALDAGRGVMSRDERVLLILLLVVLLIWSTDVLHGISPAWAALAAATACFLPGARIIDPADFGKVNLTPILYVSAVLGLGALVNESGLGERLATGLIAALPFAEGAILLNTSLLVAANTVLGLVLTLVGVPAVMTPLSSELSAATGLPLDTVLMTQVLGFSTVLMPYTAPPLVVGLAIAGVPMVRATAPILLLAVLTVVLVIPLSLVWWWALGWL